MKSIIVTALWCLVLALSSPGNAAEVSSDNGSKRQLNLSVLDMDRDASIFIESLSLIEKNETKIIAEFFEYRLAEIVCASWDKLGTMNPSQKKITTEMLANIKKHMGERKFMVSNNLNTSRFSTYLAPYDGEFISRANSIMSSID